MAYAVAQNASSPRLSSNKQQWVQQNLTHLSLEEKVGQMMQVRVYAQNPNFGSLEYVKLRENIQKYHIGSVDLCAHMLGPNLVKGAPRTVASVLNQLQGDSALPLLVGADIERGVASRVAEVPEFQLPMAFGAAGNVKLVEEFGRITGEEARTIGIHWAYAPVADVNDNSEDPVIANRSFGGSPEAVGDFVEAFIKGAHEKGLLVTAKHFPGEGDSSIDSHVSTVIISSDLAHLQKVEFPPFQRAIAAGVDAILVGHVQVAALDSDPRRIATTSPKIINGYLRRRLGFNGLVITDALEMRGLTSLYPNSPSATAQASIDAIKAGADVIMLPTDLDGAFYAIISAVRSGEIPESRIDESVKRILTAKAALGLDKNRFVDLTEVDKVFGNPKAAQFAQYAADQSVTLVKNGSSLLPLKPNVLTEPSTALRILALVLSDSARGPVGHEFERSLKERRPDVKIFHSYYDNYGTDADPKQVLDEVAKADAVVVAAFVTHLPGKQRVIRSQIKNIIGLGGPSEELFEQVLSAGGKKVIVVALGNPYLIDKYSGISNYVCTYSTASTSEISAVKALFGEIQNNARLPITIPGVADRGFSVPWPHKVAEPAGLAAHAR